MFFLFYVVYWYLRGGYCLLRSEIQMSSNFMAVWNWPIMVIVSFIFRQTNVPKYKYFLVVTAQWNFLQLCLFNTLRGLRIYFGIPNIFWKNLQFFVLGSRPFFAISLASLSRLLTIFKWSQLNKNFPYSFLSLIPRNVFELILEFQIFLE